MVRGARSVAFVLTLAVCALGPFEFHGVLKSRSLLLDLLAGDLFTEAAIMSFLPGLSFCGSAVVCSWLNMTTNEKDLSNWFSGKLSSDAQVRRTLALGLGGHLLEGVSASHLKMASNGDS